MNERLNSFYRELKDKKVSFIGLGRSHRELLGMFAAKGAQVSLRDKRTREQIGEEADRLEAMGIRLLLGENYLEGLCSEDLLLRTPGMYYFHPALQQARQAGVAVTSEMELFFDLCPCKIYAVTGSDGKTTTTSVIAELLKKQGYRVFLGGNIGFPLLPRIEQIEPQDRAVVELSSFQLISMRRSPDVAVVTNVTPNHLDVHKDMQEYIDAKRTSSCIRVASAARYSMQIIPSPPPSCRWCGGPLPFSAAKLSRRWALIWVRTGCCTATTAAGRPLCCRWSRSASRASTM